MQNFPLERKSSFSGITYDSLEVCSGAETLPSTWIFLDYCCFVVARRFLDVSNVECLS